MEENHASITLRKHYRALEFDIQMFEVNIYKEKAKGRL
jgi:hypothetical protein